MSRDVVRKGPLAGKTNHAGIAGMEKTAGASTDATSQSRFVFFPDSRTLAGDQRIAGYDLAAITPYLMAR